MWLANQNCVTPHCWLSRRDRLEEPDQIVFDLDPSTSDFAAVRATARACADVLDDLGLASYLKSTGSRGLHVVVPISRGPDFDTARQFARDVAGIVAADDPAHRTVEQRKDKRGDRIYLDVMRNAYAQTAVAPYAVRARGAPRWPRRWSGTSWAAAACGPIGSQSATCRNGLPGKAIHGPTCVGTPARYRAPCNV